MCGTGNRKSTGFSAPSDALRGIGCRTGTNAKEAGSVMLSASDCIPKPRVRRVVR